MSLGKKLADGKALNGTGRLTNARIDTIQNFYGRSIRDNKGDAKAMARATHAILKHYSSSAEVPRHDDCPEGPSSWCSYQRDVVVEVIQPLFDRLGAETFLIGCEECYTQNRNECLHHVIWGMASKEVYSSPQEISTAISLGVLQFNQGYGATYADLLPRLVIQVFPQMEEAWKKLMLRGSTSLITDVPQKSSSDVSRSGKKK